MKRMIKDYFSFTKRERTAVILLLVLSAGFIALPYFFPVKYTMPTTDPALVAFVEKSKKLVYTKDPGPEWPRAANSEKTKVSATLFYFDPNNIGAEDWVRLGVSPKTAATILRYRSKGGRFRSAEDIRKIWGLQPQLAARLVPFVRMATPATPQFYKRPDSTIPSRRAIYSQPASVEINTATAEEWKSLPGIGEVLSNRIIHYRDRIGGFADLMQVKKVYGISDSVFQTLLPFLRVDMAQLPKLDLNTVSPGILQARTGIAPETARGIVSYRRQYGPFKTVIDLKNIVFVTDSVFSRIEPFVVVKP